MDVLHFVIEKSHSTRKKHMAVESVQFQASLDALLCRQIVKDVFDPKR
jgi:hypothetical protein